MSLSITDKKTMSRVFVPLLCLVVTTIRTVRSIDAADGDCAASWSNTACLRLKSCSAIGTCSMEDLGIQGTFPSSFDDVTNTGDISEIDFSSNDITNLDNLHSWDFSKVTDMLFNDNRIDALNEDTFAAANMPLLSNLRFRLNEIESLSPDTFSGTFSHMSWLALGENRISNIPIGFLEGMPNLYLLNLSHNEMTSLDDGVFDPVASTLQYLFLDSNYITNIESPFKVGFDVLSLLLVNDQESDTPISLRSYSFSGLNNEDLSIAFSGCIIREIPPYAFGNSSFTQLLLEGVGIVTVEDYAFSGSSLEVISLRKNDVHFMSHLAASGLNSLTVTECTDYPNWRFYVPHETKVLTCEEYVDTSNLIAEIQDKYLLSYQYSSAGISPREACCVNGGGNKFGRNLVMSDFSTVFCRPESKENISGSGAIGHVKCGCSSSTYRYDDDTHSCKEGCLAGQYWIPQEFENVDEAWNAGYLTDTRYWHAMNGSVGRCEECQPGRVYDSTSNSSWPEDCPVCPVGKFSAVGGAKTCNDCTRNTFSEEGATQCKTCAFGKTSSGTQGSCQACPAWTYGSEHCEVPVLGMFMIFLSVLVASGFIFILRQRMIRKSNQLKAQTALLKATADDMKLLSTAWNLSWSDVRCETLLAAGGAGEVWKGTYCGRWEVAVKKMHPDLENDGFDNDKEVNFLRRARHSRLVMMIGCGQYETTIKGGDVVSGAFIVLEYMEKGSLDELLWNNDGSLDWSCRLQLLIDVGEGMEYLHGVHRSIHRDLKSPNVLLAMENDQLRAKVGDFGLARILEKKHLRRQSSENASSKIQDVAMTPTTEAKVGTSKSKELITSSMTCGAGTSLWMAPELVATIALDNSGTREAKYSQAVDIYAFGIIMYEVLVLRMPWSSSNYTWSHEVYRAVSNGLRPTSSAEERARAPAGFVGLMVASYEQNPSHRPSFTKIVDTLQKVRIEYHSTKFDDGRRSTNFDKEYAHARHDSLASPSFDANDLFGDNHVSDHQRSRSEILVGATCCTADRQSVPFHKSVELKRKKKKEKKRKLTRRGVSDGSSKNLSKPLLGPDFGEIPEPPPS